MSEFHFTATPKSDVCKRAIRLDDEVFEVLNKLIEGVEIDSHKSSEECCLHDDSKCMNDHSSNQNRSCDGSAEKIRHRSGCRKIRIRHRKHKWKPYHKLTGDERRRLDERNTRRAEAHHRQRMEIYGLTLAPFNTTQYLMEEHERDNMKCIKNKDDYNSSEDLYSSPDDDMDYIQKEFTEIYDTCHESYINNLDKTELVRELIRLEDEIESLEHRSGMSMYESSLYDYDSEFKKIEVFRDEIEKLNVENQILEQRNQVLRSQLSKLNAG